MSGEHVAPYGSWRSPITADVIVGETVGLGSPQIDGPWTYWLESRPADGGRTVVVRARDESAPEDVTPHPFNVRTQVHEYGGGAYLAVDGQLYFSNLDDHRLYRRDHQGSIVALTLAGPWRYADLAIDSGRQRLIAVREDHSSGSTEAVNTIVAIDLGTGEQQVLVSGSDFYSSPRLNHDADHLAWLSWNHPNMPWDGCELWSAPLLPDGTLGDAECLAGGKEESIFQPEWSPDGSLYFVSDRTGWWNLYHVQNGEVEALTSEHAELGLPQWTSGMSTYAIGSPHHVICIVHRDGQDQFCMLFTASKDLRPIEVPYTSVTSPRVAGGRLVFIGASPVSLPEVVQLYLATERSEVLRRAGTPPIDTRYYASPHPIQFFNGRGETVHAIFYPPHNPDCIGPESDLPPLIVESHGGPTASVGTDLDLSVQYWTSRGFGVVSVNYGGSAGYGRAYRQRLDGGWGVVDVEDCVCAAEHLAAQNLADPKRLVIHGGSAGGYTALCAMTFHETFAAAASYFGVADLAAFARDTHKFESRYLERLVGPFPERADVYRARSALAHADRISRPIILFQGLDDTVVPPNQAETMVAALRRRGIPFAYVTYSGEGHGFRQAKNIKRTFEAELHFYGRILGFQPADPADPVTIENMPVEVSS